MMSGPSSRWVTTLSIRSEVCSRSATHLRVTTPWRMIDLM